MTPDEIGKMYHDCNFTVNTAMQEFTPAVFLRVDVLQFDPKCYAQTGVTPDMTEHVALLRHCGGSVILTDDSTSLASFRVGSEDKADSTCFFIDVLWETLLTHKGRRAFRQDTNDLIQAFYTKLDAERYALEFPAKVLERGLSDEDLMLKIDAIDLRFYDDEITASEWRAARKSLDSAWLSRSSLSPLTTRS
jgi:hypothetical protein